MMKADIHIEQWQVCCPSDPGWAEWQSDQYSSLMTSEWPGRRPMTSIQLMWWPSIVDIDYCGNDLWLMTPVALNEMKANQ